MHDPQRDESLSSDNVYGLLEDSQGRLWVATEGGLNLLVPATGGFVRYRHDPDDPTSLGSDDVMSVFESRGGRIWAATYGGGLNLLDISSGRFTRYTTRDGLPNDSVYGALEDDEGFLWLSTNNGLSRFDFAAKAFKNFDVSDGLQSNEFNSWAFHRGASGRMNFGGINGVNSFDPGQITDSRFVPPVALTSFKIFNRDVDLGTPVSEVGELRVDHGQKVLSFRFTALDFAAPNKNLYAHKLEGFDDDWVYTQNNRDVTYTNLDPGRYLLRVKGSNRDGVWNEAGLTLPLVVVPPVWMTWWFRLLALLALLLLASVAYALRTRAIRVRNRRLKGINDRLGEQIRSAGGRRRSWRARTSSWRRRTSSSSASPTASPTTSRAHWLPSWVLRNWSSEIWRPGRPSALTETCSRFVWPASGCGGSWTNCFGFLRSAW